MALELALYGIRVLDQGAIRTLNRFSGSAHNAGKATEKFERTTHNLTAAMAGLGAFFGLRQMVEYADTWTLINARIRVVTSSMEQASAVQERLYNISQRTRNTLAATSVLYTRTALNADELGRSHEELLTTTESVNAALLLSGATGVEAAQSMRQLAQAMGKGKLDGDEFRTVMEAMPLVSRAIADEMGVATGALYDLSEAGQITTNMMIDALIAKNKEWMDLVEEMPFTVGQAYEIMANAVTRLIGILNFAFSATDTFSGIVRKAADNVDRIFAAIIAATSAILAYRAALLGAAAITTVISSAQAVANFIRLATALRRTADAAAALRAATMGILPVIAAIAAGTAGFLAYKRALDEINKATELWIQNNSDLSEQIGPGVVDPPDEELIRNLEKIADIKREAAQDVLLSAADAERAEELEIRFERVNAIIEARRNLQGDVLNQMIEAIRWQEQLAYQALQNKRQWEEITDVLEEQEAIVRRFARNLQREMANTFESILSDGVASFGDLFDAIKRMFFRMVAEIASARFMQNFGEDLRSVLTDAMTDHQQMQILQGQITAMQNAAQRSAAAAGGAYGPDPSEAVPLEGMVVTVDNEDSLAKAFAKQLGPLLAGAAIGGAIGGTTTNPVLGGLGGAAGGAAVGASIGGPVGAIVGGIAGGISGILASNKKQEEELQRLVDLAEERNRILIANNARLQEMRDEFNGYTNRDLREIGAVFEKFDEAARNYAFGDTALFGNAFDQALLDRVANDLGIVIRDSEGNLLTEAMFQLREAVELTTTAITSWGNNVDDVRRRQEAYNAIFGVEDSPQQALRDAYDALVQLAPDLMREMGLSNLNLDSPEAREALLAGFQEIFNLIDSGLLDPALLGAFDDKNALIDAIVRATGALEEFNQQLIDVTTDFPRVADIPYYEQLFGRFTTEPDTQLPVTLPDAPSTPSGDTSSGGITIQGDVIITNESGDSGEDILLKIERAAARRRTLGGSVDVDRSGENLF